MQARPVGSRGEAANWLQGSFRPAIPREKHHHWAKKRKKMALMGTGLRDAGKYVERGGRGRVQKKHGIKERERPLRRVNLASIFVIWMNRLVRGKQSLNSLKDVCSGKQTLRC